MEANAVEALVRDEVRARGIDPLLDPASVRALVDQAMASVEADADADDVATQAFHSIAGFGPLQPLLAGTSACGQAPEAGEQGGGEPPRAGSAPQPSGAAAAPGKPAPDAEGSDEGGEGGEGGEG